MECSGRGYETACIGAATRRCGLCGAVAYCSLSHQMSHWNDHKEECARLEKQMKRVDILHDFPFTFTMEATVQVCEKQVTRCSFLMDRSLHQIGLWKCECSCGPSEAFFENSWDDNWNLPGTLCPCTEPRNPIPEPLTSWKDYYQWRCLPLHSPATLLLQWPLSLYQSFQLAANRGLISNVHDVLQIHYLGPKKELLQLAVFGELHALFPGLQVHIELIGPEVPQFRDGQQIKLHSYANCSEVDCTCKFPRNGTSEVTLQLRRGFYHERHKDILKDSFPHLIVALNAGIAAYTSWLPTIEVIKKMCVPAIFSDYCEEAAHLATQCISTVTGHPVKVPIQLNPFRQPLAVEDTALYLPCYSNCFLFGM